MEGITGRAWEGGLNLKILTRIKLKPKYLIVFLDFLSSNSLRKSDTKEILGNLNRLLAVLFINNLLFLNYLVRVFLIQSS